jgi:hypothetical protein
MQPGIFILTLDLEEDIRSIYDCCIQRNYIMSNNDFRDIVNFGIRVINAGGDIPCIASRVDTLVSTICCFIETNFIVPGTNNNAAQSILLELEELLLMEINQFITRFLNKMQIIYHLIAVDNYGFIVTNFDFEIMEIYSIGVCNIKVTRIRG